MSYQRLAYDDADTAGQMHDDAAACETHIALPRQRITGTIDEETISMPVPSIAYADYPREIAKPRIEVSEAAAHLASRLHLHLD
jgi:hypothetical protein